MSLINQETKYSPQDYSVQSLPSPPVYKYSKIVPITGASCTATDAGITDVVFRIPTTAFNPAKSYVSMKLVTSASAGVGHAIATYNDAFPLLEGLNLITESGSPIINKMQNIREWLKVANPRFTTMKEYLQADPSSFFYPALASAGTNGAVTTTAHGSFATTGSYTCNSATTTYYENKHADINGATTAMTLTGVTLAFSSLKGTFLSADKVVVFPENLELTLQLGRVSRSIVDLTIADGTATAHTGDVAVSEIALYLCTDENLENVKFLQTVEAKEGLRIHVPTVEISKKSSEGKSQTGSLEVNASKGKRLRKILIAPFQTTTTLGAGQIMDNSNITGSKVETYYTQFNNKRIQNFDIDCKTNFMDWKEYRRKHPTDDALVSRSHFYYNWCILEEFDGGAPLNNNITAGMPLTNMQYTFDYILTTADLAMTYARFVIYENDLLITSQGVRYI